MARNGTWLFAILSFAGPAAADEALVERWDKPRRENFAMKEVQTDAIAEAIRARFGHPFDVLAEPSEAVDFDARDVTFFEALDRLAAAQRLCLVGGAPKGEGMKQDVTLVPPSFPLAPAAVSYMGASRLSVESVSALAVSFHVPFGWTEEDLPRLRVNLKWIVEPGFETAAITAMTLTEVVDDRGQRVVPRGGLWLPLAANARHVAVFELPKGARRIRRLAGTATVALPVATGEIAFVPADAGTTKTLGSASVKLDKVDGATVGLTVVGTPCGIKSAEKATEVLVRPDLYARVAGIADVTFVPFDAAGKELAAVTWSISSGDPVHEYEIGLDGVPVRFVLRAVVRVALREAPFAFADIPLPE